MRYILTICLLIAGSLASAAEPTTQKQVDVIYGASLAAWARGSQRDAERLIRQLSTEYPETPRSAFFDAMMQSNRYGDESAKRQYEKVVALAPESVEGKFAALHLKLESTTNRTPLLVGLKEVISTYPDDPVLSYAIALEYYENRQYEEALAAAQATAALVQPGPAQLHHTLANALYMLKRYEEAIAHNQRALEMEPAGWSNAGLALTLNKLKRYEEANQAYARAITFNPSPEHFLNWSRNLMDGGKFDDSLEKVDRSIQINPRSAPAWRARAYLLQKMGRWDDALLDYDQARKIEPKDAYAHRAAMNLLEKLGRDAEAAEILAQWISAGNTGEPKY